MMLWMVELRHRWTPFVSYQFVCVEILKLTISWNWRRSLPQANLLFAEYACYRSTIKNRARMKGTEKEKKIKRNRERKFAHRILKRLTMKWMVYLRVRVMHWILIFFRLYRSDVGQQSDEFCSLTYHFI